SVAAPDFAPGDALRPQRRVDRTVSPLGGQHPGPPRIAQVAGRFRPPAESCRLAGILRQLGQPQPLDFYCKQAPEGSTKVLERQEEAALGPQIVRGTVSHLPS